MTLNSLPQKSICSAAALMGLLLLPACTIVHPEPYLTRLHNEAIGYGEYQGTLLALTLRDLKTKLSLTDEQMVPIKAAMVNQLREMNDVEADWNLTADEKHAKIQTIGEEGQIYLNKLIAADMASSNPSIAMNNYSRNSGRGYSAPSNNGIGQGYSP